MSSIGARFQACQPIPWHGRYARVMGNGGVFHLRYIDGRLWPVLVWETNGESSTCPAIKCSAIAGLIEAVAGTKRCCGGDGGGAFLINEYGQVLVPACNGARRFLVGHFEGALVFENPFNSTEPIDLGKHETLKNGDPWELPYVGIPYHLHRGGRIYFYQQDESGGKSIYPPQQDSDLIRAIRRLRPYGPVRILVTHGGLVLTKLPGNGSTLSEDRWQPAFVGVINPNLWFQEE